MKKLDESSLRDLYTQKGQGHLFQFWDQLSPIQKKNFLAQLEGIDLDLVNQLARDYLDKRIQPFDLSDLKPASYQPLPYDKKSSFEWENAHNIGEAAIRSGRLALFTAAGGQGTRLGYDGPKGTYPASPLRSATLFQLFAEKISFASKQYEVSIPWFIMTSHLNHEATIEFFKENQFFNLGDNSVHFFNQGVMPAVDNNGKIILSAKDTIAMSPDGHGGAFKALWQSGAIHKMETLGCDLLSYFQVDNPLVHCVDPAFIGFHVDAQSEMSSKMIAKNSPEEKVGVFCESKQRMIIVEYSDLLLSLKNEKTASGNLRFHAGSIAVHLLNRNFIERMAKDNNPECSLSFHIAKKKVPTIDQKGNLVVPEKPNGIKFEQFIFDALPFARNPIIVEVSRKDAFSPIKNAQGIDSPLSSTDDQLRQFARWATAAGVSIPVDDTGLPDFPFEVSPLFACDQKSFIDAYEKAGRPPIHPNLILSP